MDRARIKAGKRAEAIGDVQASRIRARGEAGGDVGLRAKLASKLGLGGAGSADYSDKSKAMLQKKADALKPKDSKRTVAGRKPGETRTVELQADRNKLAAEIKARRASGGNKGSVKGARTQGKNRLMKAHGKTEAVAYKQIGSMLGEIFNLKEDIKDDIKADAKKADKNAALLKAGKRPKQAGQKSLGHYDSRLKRMQDRAKK